MILGKNPRLIDPTFGELGPGVDPDHCVASPPADNNGASCASNPLFLGQPWKTDGPYRAHLQAILPTIEALVGANFTMYTSYSAAWAKALGLPAAVQPLGFVTPAQYLDKLADVAFALGLGFTPVRGPTAPRPVHRRPAPEAARASK
eukprot:858171-Prymnesium_polylepis.1